MGKKRKTPQKRLKEAVERARGPQLRDLFPKSDYGDVWGRRIAADLALTLSDRPIDASLRTAFETFKLDPNDPYHWVILARIMSEILFGQPAANSSNKSPAKPFGRPPKWGERRRRQFDCDIAWVRDGLEKIRRTAR